MAGVSNKRAEELGVGCHQSQFLVGKLAQRMKRGSQHQRHHSWDGLKPKTSNSVVSLSQSYLSERWLGGGLGAGKFHKLQA